MNKIRGIVSKLASSEGINLIEGKVNNDIIKVLTISSNQGNFQINENDHIDFLFKETAVTIGRLPFEHLAVVNQLKGRLKDVVSGGILTKLELDYQGVLLKSILLTETFDRLQLHLEDEVCIFIKSSEIMLSK
ncbi:MAG: TOBE domain-containing protein [Crocinitomicaceae bacterium]|nr:TOBE domain-containing protein [Crocinitomicaceae bacterium]